MDFMKYVEALVALVKSIFATFEIDDEGAIDNATSKFDAVKAAFDEFLAAIK